MYTAFFLVGVKAQLHGGGSRILPGDNSGDRAITLLLITFQRVEVRTSTPVYIHTHTADHKHNQF